MINCIHHAIDGGLRMIEHGVMIGDPGQTDEDRVATAERMKDVR